MQNKGLIWASDRAEWRLARLKRRAARAQVFNYRTAAWNGDLPLPTRTTFHGVLVDAPCTGLGTWQRNPHARWTLTRADITELAEVQRRLLNHAAGSVKPGGRLIYSVCTMAREETSDVVQSFGLTHPEFILERPTAPWLPAAATREVWIWPQEWKANGMFIAQWRKG
jgi:16S rRNA (cytosine967-C5)-methyltransferase